MPLAQPDELATDVRGALVGTAYACADDVAVLRDGVLVGIVPIERLLAAGKREPMRELMDADPPVVAPGTDPESVAWEIVRRGESSVAVVDESAASSV